MALLGNVIGRGVVGSRPAAGSAGALYFATDVSGGQLQRDNGSSWDAVEFGGSSAIAFSWTAKTANYTITGTDSGILGDATSGAITITLPTAVGVTALFAVKKKDSSANTVTLATTSSQTIDGSTTRVLATRYDGCVLASDGSNWYVAGVLLEGGAAITYATATLANDLTLTSANTFYDGPSFSLAAGTWYLSAMAMAYNGSGYTPTLRLWNGTTTYAESGVSAAAGKISALALSAIVVLGSTTTVKISMAEDAAGGSMLAEAPLNSAGHVGTILNAVKLA